LLEDGGVEELWYEWCEAGFGTEEPVSKVE
jgi:hypothetical protein